MHKTKAGVWEHDFRLTNGTPRYHATYGRVLKAQADRLHAVALAVFKARQMDVIEALRARTVTVEQLLEMQLQHKPFTAALPQAPVELPTVEPWPTFGDAVEQYLSGIKNNATKSAGTAHTIDLQLKRAVKHFGRDIRLDAITTDAVTDYQRALRESGAAINTTTHYVWRLRALFRWHARREGINAREGKRPARELYVPMDTEQLSRELKPRTRWLSLEEIDRLVQHTPEPLLFPIACGLNAGMRVQEMLHLRPAFDIDRADNALVIQSQPTWKPKTKRSSRKVPISNALAPLLENHLKYFASEHWLTPSYARPQNPMPVNTFWTAFRRIVKDAGFIGLRSDPNSVSYHTLRHTFASHLIRRGADLFTVSKLLGNTVEQVENTYGHLSMDHRAAAVNRLETVFALPAAEV